jgi:hypothetical protein
LLVIGNIFGEDGIELLRESLEAKGIIDALGSLSDDEGLESDEEEEEEEEGEGEGGESGGEADQSREEKMLEEEESPVPKTDDRVPQQKTVSSTNIE